ncbi:MAG: threonine-phosphate decarboxylase CobD [Ahrensia sp.]|nr:threonine-phosphate decarboxylase CobD [Ahrensia sp.]
MSGEPLHHGGRLDAAIARFGGERGDWLDLSTGINRNAYPVPQLVPNVWNDLPDAVATEIATQAVRAAYDAPDDAAVSLAAGSQAHIQLLPWLFAAQDVAVVGTTYQEHAACWRRAGHEVTTADGLESAEASARIVIVVNPNNPDGQQNEPKDLIELARRLASRGGMLVVDEAFGDVAPQLSIAAAAGKPGLAVLKSLGKFYGLAGIRFGALLTNPKLAEQVDERLGPWAVSGPALDVAAKALTNAEWRDRARVELKAMRKKLEDALSKASFDIEGHTDLFVLASHSEGPAIWEHLARNHILVRSFVDRHNWLRFGLPANAGELMRLKAALKAFEG